MQGPPTDNRSQFEINLRRGLFQCEFTLKYTPSNGPIPLKAGPSPVVRTEDSINAMDISYDGDYVIAAANEDSVAIINLNSLSNHFNFSIHKYGVADIKFLSHRQAVHTSTKIDHNIRILDFEKQCAYLRYFRGHSCLVDSISVSNDRRKFLSASALEQKVFLWDINQEKPIGTLSTLKLNYLPPKWPEHLKPEPRHIPFPRPIVAFDPANDVFVVTANSSPDFIKFYDLRKYSSGPFLSASLDLKSHQLESVSLPNVSEEAKNTAICALGSDFTDLMFSPDGQSLLINTNGPAFHILNAFTGRVTRTIVRKNRSYEPSKFQFCRNFPQVIFTPDSQYVLGGNGSNDGTIYVWNRLTGEQSGIIKHHLKPLRSNDLSVNFIAHNPKKLQIVTSAKQNIDVYRPLVLDI